MTAVSKLTGSSGVVSVNGISIAVVDFTISLKRGVAAQSRVGKYSDRKIAGKVDLTGSFNNIDIIGDHIARLMTSGAAVASETKTVLETADTVGNWTSSDGVNTPITQDTTIKKEGTGSVKIAASGASSLNDTVTATIASKDLTGHHFIDVWIYASITGQIVSFGWGEAAYTENLTPITVLQANTWQRVYVEIGTVVDASKNAVTKLGFRIDTSTAVNIYFDQIDSHKGARLGAGSQFTIYGDAVDASSNRVKLTANNCIITGGSMKFNDSDAFIDGPIEFTMADPDADLTLIYT